MIRSSYLCLILLLVGTTAIAADSNLYYFFEDNVDPALPTNSGGATQVMHFNPDTRQTTSVHKFGKGSMEVVGDPAEIRQHPAGFTSLPNEWSGAIHKMSVVTWIRPSITSQEIGILSRITYPAPDGTILLRYIQTPYNYLTLSFISNNQNHYVLSDRFLCVLADEWVHMAVTFDEGKIVYYINGLPAGSGDVGIAFIPAIKEPARLEGFYSLPRGSYVDDFGLFMDRALSATDIEKIYNNGLEEFLKTKPSH